MRFLWRLLGALKLTRMKREGLQISSDCRFSRILSVDFGSEPYLVSIGKHVTISSEVTFVTHDGGTWVFRNQPEFRDVIKYGRIVVADNCFIGHRSTLLPGVRVGPNSVVAAGSVITKDVPSGEVWGGVPARRITTVKDYAAKCRSGSPDYDRAGYRKHKKAELLRIFPYPW